mmetsp:Transcript_14395/g.25320  ORF Transcript_14395/g.25320 Transcript_14395/m.25320 type:complete len:418 (-) Transcript_14395:169-1422(-)
MAVRQTWEPRQHLTLLLSLAALVCCCSGCGRSYYNYGNCEVETVEEWESMYICDVDTPHFSSTKSCSNFDAGDKGLLTACEVCDAEADRNCTNLPIGYGQAEITPGYVSSTCSRELPNGTTIYSCNFLGSNSGCYDTGGCSYLDGDVCNYSQFLEPEVYGCSQKWAKVILRKEICLCEGRPYIVQGQSLSAKPEHSTCGWGTGAEIGFAAKAGLAKRLQAAAGSRSSVGSLSLESELADLLTLARAELDALPAGERQKWHAAGLAEHAAVGSFAKLCLELLVAGAPPRLLRLAIKAQEEELMHAHIALSLAEDGLRRLDFPEHSLKLSKDFNALRAAAVTEGLQGEGKSALRLFARAKQSERSSPHLARLSLAMAMDEARHAELAEETLEWIEKETGLVAPRVEILNGDISVPTLLQ